MAFFNGLFSRSQLSRSAPSRCALQPAYCEGNSGAILSTTSSTLFENGSWFWQGRLISRTEMVTAFYAFVMKLSSPPKTRNTRKAACVGVTSTRFFRVFCVFRGDKLSLGRSAPAVFKVAVSLRRDVSLQLAHC